MDIEGKERMGCHMSRKARGIAASHMQEWVYRS